MTRESTVTGCVQAAAAARFSPSFPDAQHAMSAPLGPPSSAGAPGARISGAAVASRETVRGGYARWAVAWRAVVVLAHALAMACALVGGGSRGLTVWGAAPSALRRAILAMARRTDLFGRAAAERIARLVVRGRLAMPEDQGTAGHGAWTLVPVGIASGDGWHPIDVGIVVWCARRIAMLHRRSGASRAAGYLARALSAPAYGAPGRLRDALRGCTAASSTVPLFVRRRWPDAVAAVPHGVDSVLLSDVQSTATRAAAVWHLVHAACHMIFATGLLCSTVDERTVLVVRTSQIDSCVRVTLIDTGEPLIPLAHRDVRILARWMRAAVAPASEASGLAEALIGAASIAADRDGLARDLVASLSTCCQSLPNAAEALVEACDRATVRVSGDLMRALDALVGIDLLRARHHGPSVFYVALRHYVGSS